MEAQEKRFGRSDDTGRDGKKRISIKESADGTRLVGQTGKK